MNVSSIDESSDFIAQREYSRVDAIIPMEVRVVPEVDSARKLAKIATRGIGAESSQMPDLEDPALAAWLMMISNKLDLLTELISMRQQGFEDMPDAHINISGGGMRFFSAQEFQNGTILEHKILLPVAPPVPMIVYSEVVGTQATPGGWQTKVHYVSMDEEIRDEIVAFVFKLQRAEIRDKRG